MNWRESNKEMIEHLKSLGVDTGLADNTLEGDINRNVTLGSELIACTIITKSFNPSDIKILQPLSDNEESDIQINDLRFEVKRFLMPRVQHQIIGIGKEFLDSMMTENRFVQGIITLDRRSGLPTVTEKNIKIHKSYDECGVELLIDLRMFIEDISRKIIKTYKKISNNKIAIIDVRNFEIPDFDYIKSKFKEHFSSRGFFVLFITNKFDNDDDEPTPMFFSMYHPHESYKKLLSILTNSITKNPIVATESYTFRIGKDKVKGWNNMINRDADGYIIINGKRICKSLSAGKQIMMYGFASSDPDVVSHISYEKDGQRNEMEAEYLKPTYRLKKD